jgi:hypothetical protein
VKLRRVSLSLSVSTDGDVASIAQPVTPPPVDADGDVQMEGLQQQDVGFVVDKILYEGEFDPQSDLEFPEDFKRALVRVPATTLASAAEKAANQKQRGRKSDSKKTKHIDVDEEEVYNPSDMDAAIPNNYEIRARWKNDGCFHEARVLEHRKKISGLFDEREEGQSVSNKRNPGDLLQKLRRFHQEHEFMYYVHYVECKFVQILNFVC